MVWVKQTLFMNAVWALRVLVGEHADTYDLSSMAAVVNLRARSDNALRQNTIARRLPSGNIGIPGRQYLACQPAGVIFSIVLLPDAISSRTRLRAACCAPPSLALPRSSFACCHRRRTCRCNTSLPASVLPRST